MKTYTINEDQVEHLVVLIGSMRSLAHIVGSVIPDDQKTDFIKDSLQNQIKIAKEFLEEESARTAKEKNSE